MIKVLRLAVSVGLTSVLLGCNDGAMKARPSSQSAVVESVSHSTAYAGSKLASGRRVQHAFPPYSVALSCEGVHVQRCLADGSDHLFVRSVLSIHHLDGTSERKEIGRTRLGGESGYVEGAESPGVALFAANLRPGDSAVMALALFGIKNGNSEDQAAPLFGDPEPISPGFRTPKGLFPTPKGTSEALHGSLTTALKAEAEEIIAGWSKGSAFIGAVSVQMCSYQDCTGVRWDMKSLRNCSPASPNYVGNNMRAVCSFDLKRSEEDADYRPRVKIVVTPGYAVNADTAHIQIKRWLRPSLLVKE